MSFAQVIEVLSRFTVVERQELLRNVLELDDEGLSDSELALVDQRLAAYQANPAMAVAAESMAERIRTRFSV
jgi:putative addiction module component (TIGR02574 family)